MSGSANTPFFTKPGGHINLPKASYYHGIEDAAWEERMDHLKQATNVDVLAEKLVKDVVGGAKGITWHGAFAPTVRYATWLFPAWVMDGMVNGARGIGKVKRV